MKLRACQFGWLLGASLLAVGSCSSPAPGPCSVSPPEKLATSEPEGRRQDLQYLSEVLSRCHKNAFFSRSSEDFRRDVAALDARVDQLSHEQFVLEMLKVVASLGDPHTNLNLRNSLSPAVYPLQFYWFGEALYIVDATQEYAFTRGKRVLRIGDLSVSDARERLLSIIPHDNASWPRHVSSGHMRWDSMLRTLGVVSSSPPTLMVAGDAGVSEELEVTPQASLFVSWMSENDVVVPMGRKHPEAKYWLEVLPAEDAVYFQYNQCVNDPSNPMETVAALAIREVLAGPARKLVIDLRYNGGGNSLVLEPLLARLRALPQIASEGRLRVLIGRRTFSSALLNAVTLKYELGARLFGEPTGGKPNHYGEVQRAVLPNSQIPLTYSTKYFSAVPGDPESLFPDVSVEASPGDYLTGRDEVLERALQLTE